MRDKRRFLVDVGIKDLPFPMKVVSRNDPEGQHTIGTEKTMWVPSSGFESKDM
jgi:hypothetical protein